MTNVYIDASVDLARYKVVPQVQAKQYDKSGRTVRLALYQNGSSFTPDVGTNITASGKKPDGTNVVVSCTFSGNIISIQLTQQMCAVAGSYRVDVNLIKDNQRVGETAFILNVVKSAVEDTTVISSDEFQALTTALSQVGSPFHFKSAVNYADLPNNPSLNDMYYILDRGYMMAWNGESWYKCSDDRQTQWGWITGNITSQTDLNNALTQINQNKANQSALSNVARRVDAQFKINKNQTYDVDTDTATCYSADVPSGAFCDNVLKIGGKSVVMNQLVGSSTTTVTLVSGHKYFTDISNTESIQTGSGNSVSVTGGTDMVIDLTKMFGSTIADSMTVAQFKAMFPKDYYAYNTGSIVSAGTKRVDVVGKNLLKFPSKRLQKPEFNQCQQLLKGTYAFTFDLTGATNWRPVFILYDEDGNQITDSYPTTHFVFTNIGVSTQYQQTFGYTTGDNETLKSYTFIIDDDYYVGANIYFGDTSSNTAVTISQIEKGSTATSYTPYNASQTPIPSAIQSLTGYGWSAGSVYNEVDYANKKYIQRVSRVDLGSLSWGYYNNVFYANIIDKRHVREGLSGASNIVCSLYTSVNISSEMSCANMHMYEYSNNNNTQRIVINNTSYTDASAFKTAMNGVYLYYELATPIETDISNLLDEGFLEALDVEAGGTVTFVHDTDDNYRLPVPNTNEFYVALAEV